MKPTDGRVVGPLGYHAKADVVDDLVKATVAFERRSRAGALEDAAKAIRRTSGNNATTKNSMFGCSPGVHMTARCSCTTVAGWLEDLAAVEKAYA